MFWLCLFCTQKCLIMHYLKKFCSYRLEPLLPVPLVKQITLCVWRFSNLNSRIVLVRHKIALQIYSKGWFPSVCERLTQLLWTPWSWDFFADVCKVIFKHALEVQKMQGLLFSTIKKHNHKELKSQAEHKSILTCLYYSPLLFIDFVTKIERF